MAPVIEVKHPLLQHNLAALRCRETKSSEFRRLLRSIGALLTYEATRGLEPRMQSIETPLRPMEAPRLASEELLFVSILRAGNGLLEGALDIFPDVRVGHIGLARNEKTLEPSEYYWKMPTGAEGKITYVFDPMLATGNSSAAALARVRALRPQSLTLVSLLAAPEGIATVAQAHPDVMVYVACIDERLNEHGYILPGLGDAGDRMYGA